MSETSEHKAALRREAQEARRVAHEADRARGGEAALAARDHFLAANFHRGAGVVAGYRPIRSEIDPTPLMLALHAAGHRLAVPVIEGAGKPLRFREWHPEAAMTEGPFGVPVPLTGCWREPDLLIVPLLAFDRAGWRLGYGGGFYDRTLAALRLRRPVLAVGFAYAAQEVAAVPHGESDQPLDAIVTEVGVIRPGAGRADGG